MTATEIIAAEPEIAQSRPRWLVVHYAREDGDYGAWSLHAWGDVDHHHDYPGGHPFDGVDDYGRFAWVRLADDAVEVGFLIVDRDGRKDVATDRHVDVSRSGEIWLRAGDPEIRTDGPVPDPGGDVAVIHYRRPGGDYEGWELHVWEGTRSKPDWGSSLRPAGFDEFGAVFGVHVEPDAIEVRYVLHRGEIKDLPDEQRLDLTVAREVWLEAATKEPVRPDLGTLGPELDPARALATFVDRTTIALPRWFADRAPAFALLASGEGGLRRSGDGVAGKHTSLPLVPRRGGLFQAQIRHFPHLRDYRAFSVREVGEEALGELCAASCWWPGATPTGGSPR